MLPKEENRRDFAPAAARILLALLIVLLAIGLPPADSARAASAVTRKEPI
jgi:hypothetical protein